MNSNIDNSYDHEFMNAIASIIIVRLSKERLPEELAESPYKTLSEKVGSVTKLSSDREIVSGYGVRG